jgi:hypothetical protein
MKVSFEFELAGTELTPYYGVVAESDGKVRASGRSRKNIASAFDLVIAELVGRNEPEDRLLVVYVTALRKQLPSAAVPS